MVLWFYAEIRIPFYDSIFLGATKSHVTLFQPMRGEYWVRVSIYSKVTCDSVPTNERGVLGEGEHLR